MTGVATNKGGGGDFGKNVRETREERETSLGWIGSKWACLKRGGGRESLLGWCVVMTTGI